MERGRRITFLEAFMHLYQYEGCDFQVDDLGDGTIRVTDGLKSVTVYANMIVPQRPPYQICRPNGLHDRTRLHTPGLALDYACAVLIWWRGGETPDDPRGDLSAFVSALPVASRQGVTP